MCLRQRAVAAVLVATAAFTSLAVSRAMAAPMPWETSKPPTSTTYRAASAAAGDSATVTMLCGDPCYQ
ncbi:hypothetical protein [Streptomyces xanthii]|uniref:Uncharacterized protein n=1 Tax=Streptomyces xanthii TaxID=2768069 RepID=A0A7H1B0F2_9ACTN|nr:hypothetical protein [Streptomyces xanthii]QNS02207.1 hypothetical protein IAG42_00340 [Streptomyces xanthii]